MCLAYIDDVAIVARKTEELKKMMEKSEKHLDRKESKSYKTKLVEFMKDRDKERTENWKWKK